MECFQHKEMINTWDDAYANHFTLITVYYMYQNITMHPVNMYRYYLSILKIKIKKYIPSNQGTISLLLVQHHSISSRNFLQIFIGKEILNVNSLELADLGRQVTRLKRRKEEVAAQGRCRTKACLMINSDKSPKSDGIHPTIFKNFEVVTLGIMFKLTSCLWKSLLWGEFSFFVFLQDSPYLAQNTWRFSRPFSNLIFQSSGKSPEEEMLANQNCREPTWAMFRWLWGK